MRRGALGERPPMGKTRCPPFRGLRVPDPQTGQMADHAADHLLASAGCRTLEGECARRREPVFGFPGSRV